MLKLYTYDKCSTCRNAGKWLDAHNVTYQAIPIVETPPSKKLLKDILRQGDYTLRDLFNTSGLVYRQMKLKDKLPSMSEAEAIALLAANGKLCKRPIATDGERATVGFKPEIFAEVWG